MHIYKGRLITYFCICTHFHNIEILVLSPFIITLQYASSRIDYVSYIFLAFNDNDLNQFGVDNDIQLRKLY